MGIVIAATTTSQLDKFFLRQLSELGQVTVLSGSISNFSSQETDLSKVEVLLANPVYFGKLNKEVLSLFPKLFLVFAMSVGLEWIDRPALTERNILLKSATGVSAVSVAEQSWAMALALARKLPLSFSSPAAPRQAYLSHTVSHKTVGILGLGKIGQAIARIASGFEMKILAIAHGSHKLININYVSLTELCSQSDLIFLCLPLTNQTRCLLNRREFLLMKQQVIVVNCAREELIDLLDLEKAILTDKIAGYGVDLTSTNVNLETKKIYDRLLKTNRIIVTPHTAFYTTETLQATQQQALAAISEYVLERQETEET